MEQPSAPEKSSVDDIHPSNIRPPGLEFAMGVALFAMVLMVFLVVQAVVFFQGIIARSQEFAGTAFSFAWFDDPVFKERMQEHAFNGDLVASEALWSGSVCSLLILLTVYLWKRGNTALFLGLKFPPVMQFLKWSGLFVLLIIAIEFIAKFIPAFDTDFMEKVIGSTTNMAMLVVAVGVIGPLFEELLLRGLLYGSIRHMADEHTAVALTAGVFTLMHLQYSWTVMLLILPMGVVLGYARSRSGSIWVPVLLHMVNNMLSIALP